MRPKSQLGVTLVASKYVDNSQCMCSFKSLRPFGGVVLAFSRVKYVG